MASNIILFESNDFAIPAAAMSRRSSINSDVHIAAAFATMSIKGKVFTIVKDGIKKQLTKTDEDGELVPVSSINVTVLRANVKARVFYAEKYSEEGSEGAKPTCFSHDGVAPSADADEPQSKKCQLCPHAVWGSGNLETGKGTACSSNARLAIAASDRLDEPMLLRVPPASIKAFKEAVKIGDARQAPYNSLVMRIGFDREAPSPKLTFKPIGVLTDSGFDQADAMYDDETVQTIVGANSLPVQDIPALAAPRVSEADELDAAMAARAATKKAQSTATKATISEDELDAVLAPKPKAKPAPVVAEDEPVVEKPKARAKPAPVVEEDELAPVPKAKPAAKAASGAGDFMAELDSLLGSMDD